MASTSIEKRERLAEIHDEEILPLYGRRFGQMMLRALALPAPAHVLEVGCSTGHLTVEILRRLDGEGRIIAIDSSAPLVEAARAKLAAEPDGKRAFFRSQPLFPRLAFADDVYDNVISNLVSGDAPDPPAFIRELARVARPGGQVIVTQALSGTWAELLDIYREVLQKHDKLAALRALDDYAVTLPEADTVARAMEAAGLIDVAVEVERWDLLFRSAREFFFAPVIELGPLGRWKEIAGKGDEMQDVFYFIKEAIDAYFGRSAFSVGVVAGRISGRKP